MKQLICVSVFVAVLMCVFSGCTAENRQKAVTVNGKGVTSVAPDMATINLAVVTSNKNVSAAVEENAALMEKVQSALIGIGIKNEDFATANYNMYQETIYNNTNGSSTKGDYRVSNNLLVTVRNLDLVGSVIDTAVNAGVNQLYDVNFTSSDTQEAVQDARKLAMTNAYEAATVLAQSVGMKLGKVISISENNEPYPMYESMPRANDMMSVKSARTALNPGAKEISISVTVMYELK